MADSQLLAPLPMLVLEAGHTVTIEAINPTTGAAVTGVTITGGLIYAINTAGIADETGGGGADPAVVPLTWALLANDDVTEEV